MECATMWASRGATPTGAFCSCTAVMVLPFLLGSSWYATPSRGRFRGIAAKPRCLWAAKSPWRAKARRSSEARVTGCGDRDADLPDDDRREQGRCHRPETDPLEGEAPEIVSEA